MELSIIFGIMKAYGPKAALVAVLLLSVAGGGRAMWGMFNKILDKRDQERAELVGVLKAQVAQMTAVTGNHERQMTEFLTRTTEVQANILSAQRTLADEIKETRREAGVAHLGLSNGLTELSNALANLNGRLSGWRK